MAGKKHEYVGTKRDSRRSSNCKARQEIREICKGKVQPRDNNVHREDDDYAESGMIEPSGQHAKENATKMNVEDKHAEKGNSANTIKIQ